MSERLSAEEILTWARVEDTSAVTLDFQGTPEEIELGKIAAAGAISEARIGMIRFALDSVLRQRLVETETQLSNAYDTLHEAQHNDRAVRSTLKILAKLTPDSAPVLAEPDMHLLLQKFAGLTPARQMLTGLGILSNRAYIAFRDGIVDRVPYVGEQPVSSRLAGRVATSIVLGDLPRKYFDYSPGFAVFFKGTENEDFDPRDVTMDYGIKSAIVLLQYFKVLGEEQQSDQATSTG